MLDEQLMQRVLQLIWNSDLAVSVGRVPIYSASRRNPSEPGAEAENVGIDSE
jgi:hypothetical protein